MTDEAGKSVRCGVSRRWLAWARSWRVAGLSLAVLCVAVYMPGLASIPPVDRDECRFAQASRQMFEAAAWSRPGDGPRGVLDVRRDGATGLPRGKHAGGWVVPMVQDRARINKPPLVYWLQVCSAWVWSGGNPLADAMWMYRLPSALCALATVLITWRLGVSMFDARAAWTGAALLAVAPMVVWDAHQARADQLLLVCTAGAMACLWRVVRTGRGWEWVIGLWVWVGLGVLAKGFITPLVVVTALGALCWWCRSWSVVRSTRPALGMVLVVLCVAPWVWLLSRQVGLDIYVREVWNEVFLRATTGAKDGKRGFVPPGAHALLAAVLLWPACLLVWPAVGWAIDRGFGAVGDGRLAPAGWWARVRRRCGLLVRGRAAGGGRVDARLFLLAWVVPTWLVFELSPAKLPHYTMPLYPALALLVGRVGLAWQARCVVGGRVGVWGWAAVGAVLPAAVIGGLAIAESAPEAKVSAVVFAAGLVGLPAWGAVLVAVQFVRGTRWNSALVCAALATAWMMSLALWVLAPGLTRTTKPMLLSGNVTARLMTAVERFDPAGDRPIASVWREDSIVFATRGRVERISTTQQQAWLAANPRGVLIGERTVDAPGRDAVEFGPVSPDGARLPGGFAVLGPVRGEGGPR